MKPSRTGTPCNTISPATATVLGAVVDDRPNDQLAPKPSPSTPPSPWASRSPSSPAAGAAIPPSPAFCSRDLILRTYRVCAPGQPPRRHTAALASHELPRPTPYPPRKNPTYDPHRLAPPITGLAPVFANCASPLQPPCPDLDLCTLPSPNRPCPSVPSVSVRSGFRVQDSGSGKNPRPPLGSFPPPLLPIAPPPPLPACVPSLTSDLCFLTSFPEPQPEPFPLPYHRIGIPTAHPTGFKKRPAVAAVRRTWCEENFFCRAVLTREIVSARPIAAPSVPSLAPPSPQGPSLKRPPVPAVRRTWLQEAFVGFAGAPTQKITAEFFDAAFPPPPAFRLAPLPPFGALLSPATPSRLQQGPNINSAACPPSAGRGVRISFVHWGGAVAREIRRLFSKMAR